MDAAEINAIGARPGLFQACLALDARPMVARVELHPPNDRNGFRAVVVVVETMVVRDDVFAPVRADALHRVPGEVRLFGKLGERRTADPTVREEFAGKSHRDLIPREISLSCVVQMPQPERVVCLAGYPKPVLIVEGEYSLSDRPMLNPRLFSQDGVPTRYIPQSAGNIFRVSRRLGSDDLDRPFPFTHHCPSERPFRKETRPDIISKR